MSNFFIPDYVTINGGKSIDARVKISGAKNEVLGVMAAALLTDQPFELHNVPYISDVLDMGHIMMALGVDIKYSPELGIMKMHAKKITSNVLPDLALKFRASYYLWGALLARFRVTGEFSSLVVKMPGGCGLVDTFKKDTGLGKQGRATDFHFNLLQNVFGVEINQLPSDKGMKVYEFRLPDVPPAVDKYPVYATKLMSHGATFHWMLSTALSQNVKFMYNASLEYEVPHFLEILKQMGAGLRGTGSTAIVNMGKKEPGLLGGGIFDIMPDRMEAGTYALLALALRGRIVLENVDTGICRPWFNLIREVIGIGRAYSRRIYMDYHSIHFDFRGADIRGANIIASPVPGKETDLMQIWMAALTTANSKSVLVDVIWPERANMPQYADMGVKMDIRTTDIENFEMTRSSITTLYPSEIRAGNTSGMDLRGTMGLIILAAIANGESRIDNARFAFRGYPNLIRNLHAMGIDIKVSEEGTNLQPLPMLNS